MAKHTLASEKHSSGRIRASSVSGAQVKGTRREILFPTEPSTIGHEKIDRAVERVAARRVK
jgi:hypothetical protein